MLSDQKQIVRSRSCERQSLAAGSGQGEKGQNFIEKIKREFEQKQFRMDLLDPLQHSRESLRTADAQAKRQRGISISHRISKPSASSQEKQSAAKVNVSLPNSRRNSSNNNGYSDKYKKRLENNSKSPKLAQKPQDPLNQCQVLQFAQQQQQQQQQPKATPFLSRKQSVANGVVAAQSSSKNERVTTKIGQHLDEISSIRQKFNEVNNLQNVSTNNLNSRRYIQDNNSHRSSYGRCLTNGDQPPEPENHRSLSSLFKSQQKPYLLNVQPIENRDYNYYSSGPTYDSQRKDSQQEYFLNMQEKYQQIGESI